jgi:hypothetical protein
MQASDCRIGFGVSAVRRVATIVGWGGTTFETYHRETGFCGKVMQNSSNCCFLSREGLNSFQHMEAAEKGCWLLGFA